MHRKRFQLISDNGSIFTKPTLHLSTVEMPGAWLDDFGYQYESCLFVHGGDSDVIKRYQTLHEAVAGHQELCEQMGLA